MNYKQNDYELIYLVRENDEDSRDLLFEKYLPIMRSLATEFYQRFSSYGYDYDDFLQEAMIAFQKSILKFDDKCNVLFYTFTTVCMRRSLLTFCRNISSTSKNISRNYFVPIEEYNENLIDINAWDCGEVDEMLRKLILDLSFEKGCIFELRLNGFSYREIGILLDIPASSVEFKNRMARKKCERLLKNYYEEAV